MKNGLEVGERETKRWYKDGKLHREDGPAIEWANGNKFWFKNGNPYREDDLPHYESWEGRRRWYYKGKWYTSFEGYMLAKVMG